MWKLCRRPAWADLQHISGSDGMVGEWAWSPVHTDASLCKHLAQSTPGSSRHKELKCLQKRTGGKRIESRGYAFHLALIADKQTGRIGKAHRNLVGRNERLDASQSESGVLDPIAFPKTARHAVFLMGLGGCFLHHLFPGLPGFLGRCLLGRFPRLLSSLFCYRFSSSVVVFTIACITADTARLCSLHRNNSVS
jgi:hypothetical protein